MIIVIAINMYLLIYNMVITNIIYLLWLYLYIELYIILITDIIMWQDYNWGSKNRIKFKLD